MVHIATASIDDVAAIASLATELGYETMPTEMRARIERALADPHGRLLVARSDGSCVGFCHVHITSESILSEPTAEIGSLIVSSAHRSKGIGSKLVDQALSWARESGVQRARVRTNVIREGAMRFYERNGWLPAKRQQVYVFDLQQHEPDPTIPA